MLYSPIRLQIYYIGCMRKSKNEEIENIKKKYKQISIFLNEKSKRIWTASEALNLGWGGISIVQIATGIDYKTIKKGIAEIKKQKGNDRIRKCGGGRKKLTYLNKELTAELEKLVEPETRGEPDSPLLWSSKSTSNLTTELNKKGYQISQKTVYSLLKELGYSLQANRKTKEGTDNPDRDKQFHFINELVKSFQANNNPVILS
jgi:transposase